MPLIVPASACETLPEPDVVGRNQRRAAATSVTSPAAIDMGADAKSLTNLAVKKAAIAEKAKMSQTREGRAFLA